MTAVLGRLLVVAAFVSGCLSASPTPSPPPLGIYNGTTIPVTLVLNGVTVEVVAPGVQHWRVTEALPPLPWRVEARSPSGRVLSTMVIEAGAVITPTSGRAVRVDLSCGRLDVWSGPPLAGPGPPTNPGHPGDCD